MIQPSRMIQSTAARTNCTTAIRNLPCRSCPKPGMKKLARAAITLPADPCPAISIPLLGQFQITDRSDELHRSLPFTVHSKLGRKDRYGQDKEQTKNEGWKKADFDSGN